MFNLRNRSFLKLQDFSSDEIRQLLRLAVELKAAKYAGTEQPRLRGKNIALLFEKDSTRTRGGFEIAAYDQGAHVTFIGPTGSHLGHKETVKDTARVLGRMYDGIEYRGFGQQIVEDFARYSGVPVWNGLTQEFHPTQVLADLLTMTEHSARPLSEITFCFLGDATDNVGESLLIGGTKMGMDVRLAAPRQRWPSAALLDECRATGGRNGARIMVTDSLEEALPGCDFLYTDVWVSMGEPDTAWAERISMMRPYQVNAKAMALTGNSRIKFMHCLPAFHNAETAIGKKIHETFGLDCMEVTDEVFESDASIVFDQAENRLHTIKAVLVASLGN